MSATSAAASPAYRGDQKTALARLRLPLMLAGVAVVVVGGLYFYLSGGRFMSTDDAYMQAAQASISSNIPGRVIAIAVHDNQPVHRDDVLFQLEDHPARVGVDEARANLAVVRAQVEALKATYRQRLSEKRSAADSLAYRQREYARQQHLVEAGISSRAQFDQAQASRDAARQALAAADQQGASVLANLGGSLDLPIDRHPLVLQAQAELDRAGINLSYTTIHAPIDGIVTKVEQLQVGDYINAAAPVFALVSTHDLWVEANFKESQLTYMRPGETASIAIDTYPDRTFKAHVVSVAPGTGSQFAALPPENATGNWVKIVQRLPVRLELDELDDQATAELPLHSGLSATVTVDTGHRRSLLSASADTPATSR